MSTYYMFGKYTPNGLREVTPQRTKEVIRRIEKYNGKVHTMHALMGETDLLFCVDFPTNDKAISASFDLHKLTGITWTTCPTIPVEQFDALIKDV